MTFTQAIRHGFQTYFSLNGRIRRPAYWWFVLFVFLGSLVMALLDGLIFGSDPSTGMQRQPLSGLFALIVFIPLLTLGWRRLQDSGRKGWLILIPMAISLVTLLGLFLGIAAFGLIGNQLENPEVLRQPGAWAGLTGLMVMGILQFVAALMLLYWLTRPSDIGPNAYGPEPL